MQIAHDRRTPVFLLEADDYFNKNHPRQGFGHSTVSMAAENAKRTGVNQLYLYHYNPFYTDGDLDRMVKTGKEDQ